MQTESKTIILDAIQIEHKVRRIAYQIYETNIDESCIVLAGIHQNGYVFAEKLATYLEKISTLHVILCRVDIDKNKPESAIQTSLTPDQYKHKSLVLVDDVLNSGKVLMYAVRHFLDVPLKQFKTAVLINRNHKRYPVKADFKGLSLSTSLQEHVEVDFDRKEVYLS
ncbi:MAG: phosphoribosyltransferase [Bacteroidetes bacterium]|nr:phosphoribosyltransferase [Bacteroidota bacterium]